MTKRTIECIFNTIYSNPHYTLKSSCTIHGQWTLSSFSNSGTGREFTIRGALLTLFPPDPVQVEITVLYNFIIAEFLVFGLARRDFPFSSCTYRLD